VDAPLGDSLVTLLESGTTVGRYTITRRLGRGTSGVVYQAIDSDHRHVALKLMIPDVASDEAARLRFLRDAETLISLHHRNIVTTFDCGVHDGAPFIVMELLAGSTLRDRMRGQEPMSLEAKLDVVIQLCDGLQHAHERGIVHRDVKPANIWLLRNGGVKLLDFGVAHFAGSTLTQPGDVLGTVAYTSPEQLAGNVVDGRADIFAAGTILYELLTGRRPFDGDNVAAVMEKVLREDPPPLAEVAPGLSGSIREATTIALQKDPAARFPHAADFASELRLARYEVTTPPSSVGSGAEPDQPTMILEPTRVVGPDGSHSQSVPERDARTASVNVAAERVRTGASSHRGTAPGSRRGAASKAVPPPPPAPDPLARLRALAGQRPVQIVAGLGAIDAVLILARMQLSGTGPAAADYRVEVRSVPGGAVVEIDGTDSGYRTPATMEFQTPPGHIRLRLTGYETVNVGVPAIEPKRPLTLSYNLRRMLDVRSDPPGARILVNGKDTGLQTPATYTVPEPAPDWLELQLGRAAPRRAALTPAILQAGELRVDFRAPERGSQGPAVQQTSVSEPALVPEPARTAKAVVAVRVTGSYPFEVTGCGRSSPMATEHSLEVNAPCTLRLRSAQYYLDVPRTIDAASGHVELAAPQLARVQLRSRYEWCTIVLDGHAIGSPPADVEVAAGTYPVVVQCPDRSYSTRQFTIEPGRSTRRLDDLLH
jgi:serine/threonine protein kinase